MGDDSAISTSSQQTPTTPSGEVHDELTALRRQVANLERALESRDVVGMAKGILMARERCTPDAAFDMLRRASNLGNRKLVEIWQRIVDETTRRATPGQGPSVADTRTGRESQGRK